ncbi:uncharacterized protein LOC113226302 isoform X2 [Hyposmocoma kahamanoa]|nr:uncharacterized protein LOC113226302 isoform X2 [Hyposmocoma kahamanoa]
MPLYYKLESLQKSGCFKERGALCALLRLPLDKRKIGVVVASLGNEAIAMCFHAAKYGVPVIAVMPSYVPLSYTQRCYAMGAKVIVQGTTLYDAQKFARVLARDRGLTYINGRDHPDVLAGYGTIALEIMHEIPEVEFIIVPIGTGGLAAATARVVKHHKTKCQVYGVQSEQAPAFFKHLADDMPGVGIPARHTMADAIAVSHVGVNSYVNAQPALDKVVLVKEDCIARAVLHMMEVQRIVVEGAAACPLAAILSNQLPELRSKIVVCVVTGGNMDNMLYTRALDRGMSAEARLLKFRVKVHDSSVDVSQLLKLIEAGGHGIVQYDEIHKWTEDEQYKMEISLVCRTMGLDHALEIKRLLEKAYPCDVVFETEPFNDKRTCPCYVFKYLPCG